MILIWNSDDTAQLYQGGFAAFNWSGPAGAAGVPSVTYAYVLRSGLLQSRIIA
jgi:hypothetical protein